MQNRGRVINIVTETLTKIQLNKKIFEHLLCARHWYQGHRTQSVLGELTV